MVATRRPGEEGTVLVLSLIVIAFMAILVIDTHNVAQVELVAASNADVQLRLEYACRGGYQLAEAYLRQDQVDSPETDSLVDQWADPNGFDRTFDPEEAVGSFSDSGQGGDEEESDKLKVRFVIEDEERKWPLALLLVNNEATQKRRVGSLKNVIDEFRDGTSFDVDEGTADQVANMIYQFLKRTEDDGAFAPTPRAKTKSGMVLDITDLSLLPGLSAELLFDQVDLGNSTEEETRIAKGLMHFLSPWTDLVINVNTAPKAVLRGLFRGDRPSEYGVADDIFLHREDASGELSSRLAEDRAADRAGSDARSQPTSGEEEPTPGSVFTQVADVEEAVVTMTPALFNETRNLMTVQSKVYTIWVEAHLKKSKRMRRYVVRREGARYELILSELVSYPVYRTRIADVNEHLYGW